MLLVDALAQSNPIQGAARMLPSHHKTRPYPFPTEVVAFIDTTQFWLERKPGNSIIKFLKESCGHCYVKQGSPWWNSNLRCRLHLHQPSAKALRLLDDYLTEKSLTFIINQVDLALDLIVPDQHAVAQLYEFLDMHLVKKWHGKQSVQYHENTRYTSIKKWQSQQIVMYSQPQSRITGKPCVHLEWRTRGKTMVERLDIYDLGHLINFDHRAFWQRCLCLEEVDFTMLGRQFQGRGRARTPIPRGPYPDADRYIGDSIRRAAARTEYGATAQDVRDWCRGCSWFHPATSMRTISNDVYLPHGALSLM